MAKRGLVIAQRVMRWMKEHRRQLRVLRMFSQPLTVAQVSQRTGIPLKKCTDALALMNRAGVTVCLNPAASCGRVYWLTDRGATLQRLCALASKASPPAHFVPNLDWSVYGEVTSASRSLVIKSLNEPIQPSRLKRVLYHKDPSTRLSANNAARVMRFLLEKEVVERVWPRRRGFPLYRLTPRGEACRDLLNRAHESGS